MCSDNTIKKWLLINPPTGKYMRETRCQAPLKGIIAAYLRPPLDLAYIAGSVCYHGDQCNIIDYPAEKKTWNNFKKDLLSFNPDYLVVNTTGFTISDDLIACKIAKSINTKIMTLAKGAVFYHEYLKIFNECKELDVAVINDEEMGFGDIAGGKKLYEIAGIIYRSGEEIINNPQRAYICLDDLPEPRRDLINNKLYKRSDTGEIQTSILIGRGCNGGCIFCVAPLVNGNKCRYRSIKSVINEIDVCINRYNIRSFTFYADTFTWDREWVNKFCLYIIDKNIKISWLCNSRVDCLDEDILILMKKAGCWGISIGVESGSQLILDKINKRITLNQVSNTVHICRKHKIVTLLHFMIGFPWDSKDTIITTIKFAKQLGSTLVDFNIVTPFSGTPLWTLLQNYNLILENASLKKSNYQKSIIKTFYLNHNELEHYRNKAINSFYLNYRFITNALVYIKSLKHFTKCGIVLFNKMYWILLTALKYKMIYYFHMKGRK